MNRSITFLITLAILLIISAPILAQEPQSTFHFGFQGKLSDVSGNPVPDGYYDMNLLIYTDSIGGTPRWSESHPRVQTSNGFFSLEAGSIAPCSLGIATYDDVYVAAQIGTEPPMARRFRLLNAPNAGVARRIYGDLQTLPGSLMIHDPGSAQSSISLNTGSENMGIVIEDRPADPVNARRFHAGIDSGEVNLGFEGPNGQNLFSVSGKPGALGKLTWGLFNPQPEPPAYEAHLLMEASTSPGGKASWVMFNPQPEPPASDPLKLIEISNGVGGDAGIYMFNPQPEPPATDPFLGLTATANGPRLNMYAPQISGARLVNDHPQIGIRCDSTASRMLLQRAFDSMAGPADSIGISMYADSVSSEMRFFKGNNVNLKIATNVNGTSSSYLDDGSEYMGVEPSPWHSGGDLTMYDATGGMRLLLASNGMVSIGTGNHTNILTIQQYSATDPVADAWTTYSSRRWKTNIQPLQGSLAKVMQLNGVSFNWRETGKHDIGLIAEDVGQVVPEVVAYEDNGVDAKSVDYARLTALLIEAVKEQQKTIDQLKSELDDLKGQPNIRALLQPGK
jgi:hypothetical protein